jgi:Domain of unknown function (DUF4328)
MPESLNHPRPTPLNPLQSVVLDSSANQPLRGVGYSGGLAILAILAFALASAAFILLKGWTLYYDLDDELFRRGLYTLQIIRAVLYIITAIWFLRWTWLCAANAKHISPSNPDIHPPSAVGSYFVPFLNFFGPYQQLREIVATIEKRLDRSDITPLIRPWWLAWWGMNAVYFLSSEIRSPIVMVGEFLLTFCATTWLIRLISRLNHAQSEILPPFEVVHTTPKPKPKHQQVRSTTKPAYTAAKPSVALPQRPRPPARPLPNDPKSNGLK